LNKKLVGVLGIIGLMVAAGGLIVQFDTTTQPADGEVKFEMNTDTPQTTETSDSFIANYLVQTVQATNVEDVQLYSVVMGAEGDTNKLTFEDDGDTGTLEEGDTLDGAGVIVDADDFEEDDLRITFEMTDPNGDTIIDETSQDWTSDPTYAPSVIGDRDGIDFTFPEETLEEGTYEINVVLEAYY